MYCKPSNSVKDRCIHYKVDFKSPSWAVWSLGCHNDSLVLLVFFEDIHIRTGSLSVFWVTWSSSWHPKERLDLTHIMLSSGVPGRVTTRAVFGLAERSLAWHRPDWRFHQYWILMNGSYMSSAHQWLQWWWSLSRWKKSTGKKLFIVWCGFGEEEEEEKERKIMPSELKHRSCRDHYQLVTTDALLPQWLKYSVSHVCSFSHCPSVLPSTPFIVALPCPILSSSHCVCVKKLVSPLGQGAWMPGWNAPGENAFWTPLVPLVWCSASLCCWVSLSGTPGGPLLQTPPMAISEPPTLLKLPSSSECCSPVLLGRATRGTACSQNISCLWSETTVMHSLIQRYPSRHQEGGN